ncbi:rad23 protein [Reticulomyxa filosa]|uniref:Rad23 protein n=1 Tax=Reticulomyxa filosa TaxID=46433 RepID=X6MH51_RETFI|nr:rad23 protein [Reticulomyxa filosa]|eukprot:ETO12762.1 rad23 protein [Reticulomyxa filosa]
MIIQIKTLQNNKFDLEVDANDTVRTEITKHCVAQIKERIHSELDLGEPENQKLIHRGKILKDDQTAQSIGLKEKDFVVVMVKKGKGKKADETESTNTEEATTSSTSSTTTSQVEKLKTNKLTKCIQNITK